jgi:hypothetical protein
MSTPRLHLAKFYASGSSSSSILAVSATLTLVSRRELGESCQIGQQLSVSCLCPTTLLLFRLLLKRHIIRTVSQEERSIFWEVIVSVILSKIVYVHVSYSERFPRYSYFTEQTSNTPCPHTSYKVHWCWRWNFRKYIVAYRPVAKRWLTKQRPLLCSARNIRERGDVTQQ